MQQWGLPGAGGRGGGGRGGAHPAAGPARCPRSRSGTISSFLSAALVCRTASWAACAATTSSRAAALAGCSRRSSPSSSHVPPSPPQPAGASLHEKNHTRLLPSQNHTELMYEGDYTGSRDASGGAKVQVLRFGPTNARGCSTAGSCRERVGAPGHRLDVFFGEHRRQVIDHEVRHVRRQRVRQLGDQGVQLCAVAPPGTSLARPQLPANSSHNATRQEHLFSERVPSLCRGTAGGKLSFSSRFTLHTLQVGGQLQVHVSTRPNAQKLQS